MKITMLTHGTRGDVQPFLALAIALKEKGHTPTLAAPENFKTFVSDADISFVAFSGDTQKVLKSPSFAKILEEGDAQSFLNGYAEAFAEHFKIMEQQSLEASKNADIIIAGICCFEDAFSISEKLGTPFCLVSLCPSLPATGEFPQLLLCRSKLPFKFANRISYWIFERLHWQSCREGVNSFRAKLELPKLKSSILGHIENRKIPIIHAFSRTVCPIPSDWKGENFVSGFFETPPSMHQRTENTVTLPLIEWIKNGKKPIFFGFGSLPMQNTDKIVSLISGVLNDLGERAILATGWSPPPTDSPNSNIFTVKSVDFNWLFPLCSVVVHQGGAGTTHAGLKAGVPTIVCAFIADQFYWGSRIEALKVGKWMRYKEINYTKLKSALQFCLSEAVAKQAVEVSRKIESEGDAIPKVIQYLEQIALKPQKT